MMRILLCINSLISFVALFQAWNNTDLITNIILGIQIAISSITIFYELYLNIKKRLSIQSTTQQNQCTCYYYIKTKKPYSIEDATLQEYKGIKNLSKKVEQILPFLWPKENLKLKGLILLSLCFMILGRIVNVWIPKQYAKVINDLSQGGELKIPLESIVIFVILRALQSNIGLLSNLQQFSWIKVGQFTTRQLSVSMLSHLLNLSMQFHLNRKTGEILRVQDRGVASVVSVLNAVLFNILPTIFDITIAIIIFVTQFDIYIGIIVFITSLLFITLTIKLTDWRTKYRRKCNKLDNLMEAKAVDSLLNFETIKYFNNEQFEVNEYAKSIDNYQTADIETKIVSSILNTLQNIIIQIGLFAVCLIAAYRVINKQIEVYQFVQIVTYIDILYEPLKSFGGNYKTIQKNLVDMENMLDLFKVSIEIKDPIDAKPFDIIKGGIEFINVGFAYDNKFPILKNISFKVNPGQTVALVGPSGSGKSTILKLLFRFYDINSGRILIDKKEIREMKIKDLRKDIGVVPQDTVLFNEDIYYNINYSKINSTKQQVENAAKVAHIHERILNFPKKYSTMVGERGLRLSGGEKQRIALARTFLKDPKIVLLDEATSALDINTERQIQLALKKVTKDRTTLIIAHRLSTIIDADVILVLKEGRIVERGNHHQLINNKQGVYYDMWHQQLNENNNKIINNKSSLNNIKETIKLDKFTSFDSDESDNDSIPSIFTTSTSCPAFFK